MKTIIKSATVLLATMTLINAFAQDTKKPASPPATATGKIKDATITINYSSPSVKGRTIWGGLEAYDKVWRAGLMKQQLSKRIKTLPFRVKNCLQVNTAFS
jgi:hypothetical protein